MSATLYREGTELDALLAELDGEYPGRIRVLEVLTPREGGVFGFFAKQRVGVRYRLLSDDGSVVRDGAATDTAAAGPASGSAPITDASSGLLASDDFAELLAEITEARKQQQDDVSRSDSRDDTVEWSDAVSAAAVPDRVPVAAAIPAAPAAEAAHHSPPVQRVRQNHAAARFLLPTPATASDRQPAASIAAAFTATQAAAAAPPRFAEAATPPAVIPVEPARPAERISESLLGPATPRASVAPDSPLADFLRIGGADIAPTGTRPARNSISAWTPPTVSASEVDHVIGRHTPQPPVATPENAPVAASTPTPAPPAEELVAGITTAPPADSPLFGPTPGRLALRRNLLELGVPIDQVPHDTPHPYAAVESLVEQWHTTAQAPTADGEVLIIAGPLADLEVVRDKLLSNGSYTADDVWGYRCPEVRHDRIIMSADQAEELTQQWRDELAPAKLVLVATDRSPAWSSGPRGVIESLAADALWAVVDATRKTADSRSMTNRLGEVDALLVTRASDSASPATVWELDRAVAFLDGQPSSDSAWAVLLLDKLSEIE